VKNIVLIGFKCCGKTCVGESLAKKMHKQFIDLDKVIEEIHGKEKREKLSFREIYKKYGAEYFRSLEAKAVEKVAIKKDCVIAFGGGTVVYSQNTGLLKKNCTMINFHS